MPELPDVSVYAERLAALLSGEALSRIELRSLFVLRSVEPPVDAVAGHRVCNVSRMGKRIVLHFDNAIAIVIHLMIAGRLRWRIPPRTIAGKHVLAVFQFPNGTLYFTEAGTKRRASMQVVHDPDGLAAFARGGLEVFEVSLDQFSERLRSENHTLKRSLTDPRLFSGIGNAYSDEILHRARLSPLAMSRKLDSAQVAALFTATRDVLAQWTERLRRGVGTGFPEEVTAFHPEMAVHGKFGQPCPDCGTPVQRIRYADNETNYCARCQTGGRLLADRAMSRLLKGDWPRSIDDLE